MTDARIPVILAISHLSDIHPIRTTNAASRPPAAPALRGALGRNGNVVKRRARTDGYSFLPASARAKTKRSVDSIGA
jgi:hypothetical protein